MERAGSSPETVTKSSTLGNASSPRFGVGPLLDLLETGVGAANPIAGLLDFSRIHRNGARNFFGSCYQHAFILHWFRALDWEFPMMPEFVEGVIHGLGLDGIHAAATHRVVEHAVAILPW